MKTVKLSDYVKNEGHEVFVAVYALPVFARIKAEFPDVVQVTPEEYKVLVVAFFSDSQHAIDRHWDGINLWGIRLEVIHGNKEKKGKGSITQ